MEALVAYGMQSVSGLATITGRRPKGLYFHLKALEAVDLVYVVEVRRTQRRPEAIYAVRQPRMRVDLENQSPEYRLTADKTIETSLRQTLRQFQKYTQAVREARSAPGLSGVARVSARLSPEAVTEVRSRMLDLIAYVKEQSQPDQGQHFVVSMAILPLIDREP